MEKVNPPSRGEALEGIAFQFCKVATVALIAGRWVLPISSGACAIFFLAAFANGKRDTRCFLRSPLLAAAVFGVICAGSIWWMVRR